MEEHSSRSWPWLLTAMILMAFGLGKMALTDPDEARYAAVAREMLRSGDVVIPTYNGEPRLNKPPLLTWLQVACFRMGKISETSARFPPFLAGLATLGLTGWWARRRLGRSRAGPAIALLATTLIFFVCARLAILDMLLACGVTGTLLCWREAVVEADPTRRRLLSFGSALSCGLATLAKGPVGFFLPVFVIVLTTLWTSHDGKGKRSGMITPRGILLGLVGLLTVAGPWASALAGRIGWSGLGEILQREVLERTVTGLDHARPWYYFLVTFWPAFLPWSLSVPVLAFRALRDRRVIDGQTRFLVCWLGGVILFFSIPADKNDAYLLPAAPALALLAVGVMSRRAVAELSIITALLLGSLGLILPDRLSHDRSLRDLVEIARLAERDDYELVGYRLEKPSLLFYADHGAHWIRRGDDLRALLGSIPAERSVAIVMTRRRHRGLPPHRASLLVGYSLIAESAGYVVLFREGGAP